jgi:TolB protein
MTKTSLLLLFLVGFLFGQAPGDVGIFEGASDIGSPSHKGSATFDAAKKEYRVTGGGNNIWGNRDDFYFVWRKITGDVVLTANVKIVTDGAPHRKAGLMIRKDLETGATYADVMVHGSGLTGLQWREKTGEITRGVRFPVESPTRIRLERRRNAVTVWVGKEGGPLQEAGSTDVAIGNPVYVGLAVCSHDDKASTTALFSDVTIETPPGK